MANDQLQMSPPPPPPIRVLKTRTKESLPRLRQKPAPRRVARNARPKLPVRRELSAGGVVVRQERDQWLVALLKTEHKRGEVWVLPKGHVELHKKERISDAAKREVEEELGISGVQVRDQLGVARFSFQAEDAIVRKTVHYYLMITQQKALHPQEEEYFLEAAWFPFDVAIRSLEYDTDQKVVARAQEQLTGKKTAVKMKARPHKRASRGIRMHL